MFSRLCPRSRRRLGLLVADPYDDFEQGLDIAMEGHEFVCGSEKAIIRILNRFLMFQAGSSIRTRSSSPVAT